MAVKQIWLNLPVKNIPKSKIFFNSLGFKLNPKHPENDFSACYLIGEANVAVMLFPEATFESFIQHTITDTTQNSEILISIDAESIEEVDELAKKAVAAGGILFGKPSLVQGWMYCCGFTDLDGHRWNVLYMDTSKIPTSN